jgi:hypothetical protein
MAAKETIGYCLAAISTLGVARTKSTAIRETISLVETSSPKNTLVDRGMTSL